MNRYFIGALGVSLVLLAAVAVTAARIATPQMDLYAEATQAITYEEVSTYFDAMMVGEGGMIFYECRGDNLDKIPNRNQYLEEIAKRASDEFFAGGRVISPHLAKSGMSPPADGESLRGAFLVPAVKEEMLPFFEKAKRDFLATHEAKKNTPAPPRS